MTPLRDVLTDELLIQAVAAGEPEYRGAGVWCMTPKDSDAMRAVLLPPLEAHVGWQSMETAPKDAGIMVFSQSLGCVLVAWNEHADDRDGVRTKWSTLWDSDLLSSAPTHWMPLPPSPQEER